MANVEIYQRQVLPEARLASPRGENSLAEAFGAGLTELGKTGASVARQIAKTDAIVQERNDAATVARKKPEAVAAYDKIYRDAVAAAPEGASGFSDTVQQATTDYNKQVLEGLSPGARTDLEEYLGLLQASTLKGAHSYQAAADLAKRSRDTTDAANAWINHALENPGDLPAVKTQIHELIAGQKLDANAAADLEHGLVTEATDAAMRGAATKDPKQFLANADAGKWDAVDPDRLSQAKAQARSLLQLKQTQAAAEQATRAVGLQTKVAQAIEIYKSGGDFAGFDALAGELKAAGQTGLLQTLTAWNGDAGYARMAQSLTPEALKVEAAKNEKLAETTKDPTEANTYRRQAQIAGAALQINAKQAEIDPLSFAVRTKIAAPTDMLGPLLNGNIDTLRQAARDRETARGQTGAALKRADIPYLTPEERRGFMQVYNAQATAEQKTDMLDRLTLLPEGMAAGIAAELKPSAGGGDIPMYLSFLSEDRNLGHDIIAGAGVLKRYPKMLPDDGLFEDALDLQFGNLLAENIPAQQALREATTDYYAALLHSKRGEHAGALNIGLLKDAFRRVTGGAFVYENGHNPPQVILPPRPGMTLPQFEALVSGIDDRLLVNQSARAPRGGGQRGPIFANGRPVTARDIQEEGSFASVGPGLYRVLIRGEPVHDAQTGDFFVLDLKPLLAVRP